MRLSNTSPLDPAWVANLAEGQHRRTTGAIDDAAAVLCGDVGQIQGVRTSRRMATIRFDNDAPEQPLVTAEAQQAALDQATDEGVALGRAAGLVFDTPSGRSRRSAMRHRRQEPDQPRVLTQPPMGMQRQAFTAKAAEAPEQPVAEWPEQPTIDRPEQPATPMPEQPTAESRDDQAVTTDSMMETAEVILRQFLFLSRDASLAGGAYRQLQQALSEVMASPDDLNKKLNLYSRLTYFVQWQRTADLSKPEYQTALEQAYSEMFGSTRASDAQVPRPAEVQELLDTLGYGTIRELQAAIGMQPGQIDGVFGPKTFYFVQLHLLELMAKNLNQRDRLANALLTQKLQAAEHTVSWVQSLQGNLADRLKANQLDPIITDLIQTNGFRIDGGQLIDRQGRRLSEAEINEVGRFWLNEAIALANEAHNHLEEVERLHRSMLSDDEARAYEDASASYRRLYAQIHNGQPSTATNVQEAVTDEALRGHVVHTDSRVAFLSRMRTDGVDERTLNQQEKAIVDRLARYARRRNGKLFLVMSDAEWQRVINAVDVVLRPRTQAAQALSQALRRAFDTLFTAMALAEFHGISLAEAVRLGHGHGGGVHVDRPHRPVDETPAEEAPQPAPPAPTPTRLSERAADIELEEAPARRSRVQATGRLQERVALTALDQDDKAQEKYWQDMEAAWSAAEAAQAKGAERRQELRRANRVTGNRVVVGLDGRAIAYATNADGKVVGMVAAPATRSA